MAVTQHGKWMAFTFPGIERVRCIFTTRHAGDLSLTNRSENARAAVLAARRALVAELDIPSWTELVQVHGDTFCRNVQPTACDAPPALAADGHATDRTNHALCIKTADCQPILLAHPSGCVGAVHAGWRGNALHFPTTAVTAFCEAYGLNAAEVRAVRGPSLGHAEFVNFDREWPHEFAPWHNEATHLVDLWGLTRAQLQAAGLRPEHIYGLDLCTWSMNHLFFSHRRGDAGRQMGLIWTV